MEHSSSSNETVSSQKTLPSSHDPGWNDPPAWALTSQRSAGSTSTKKFLNKRVAFPLSQNPAGEKASPPPASNMPPVSAMQITTAPHKPLVTPVDRDTTVKPLESDFDKAQALSEVLTNFESMITEHEMEKSKLEEIQKRLGIMKANWLEDKLSNKIQSDILDMSKALQKRDIEHADKIHIDLMMQHANVCRAWIPAIRHIILELKEKCKISQPEHSLLLPCQDEK